jgi:hypothetical protein
VYSYLPAFLLTFFFLRIKKIESIKPQQPIIAVQKIGVAEEGASMIDKNKTRPHC